MEWMVADGPVAYETALAFMEARAEAIHAGEAGECVWLLEHPPLYTAGTSAKRADLIDENRFPVYAAGRGGEYTYHGPGQRVAYVMMDLKKLFAPDAPDLRAYIQRLEAWIIAALSEFGVKGEVREGRIGVWVSDDSGQKAEGGYQNATYPDSTSRSALSAASWGEQQANTGGNQNEAKIAAIGVRVRKWVAFHGICINVNPDLSHYAGIVPCGIRQFGVTSLSKLGRNVSLQQLDNALRKHIHVVTQP